MIITLIRAVIIYVITVCSIRFMGKRQIGELQPSELVTTILISEIATIPIQDNSLPVLNSAAALIVLVCFEVISSVISMKSYKCRRLLDGNPVVIIRDGVIDQNQMKKLRITTDDLLCEMRQKDIFSVEEIEYAVFETNGKLSILTRAQDTPVTPKELDLKVKKRCFPITVVCDGCFCADGIKETGISQKDIMKIIKRKNLELKSILLMTVDCEGKEQIITKEENR